MPLKSKASDARQARATPAAPKQEKLDTVVEQDTSTFTDSQLPASDAPSAGDAGGTSVDKAQRKSRTADPAVAARKAAGQRQKDILVETKKVKHERETAVRDVERTYSERLKALEAEYNLLTQQQTKGVFS